MGKPTDDLDRTRRGRSCWDLCELKAFRETLFIWNLTQNHFHQPARDDRATNRRPQAAGHSHSHHQYNSGCGRWVSLNAKGFLTGYLITTRLDNKLIQIRYFVSFYIGLANRGINWQAYGHSNHQYNPLSLPWITGHTAKSYGISSRFSIRHCMDIIVTLDPSLFLILLWFIFFPSFFLYWFFVL